MTDEVVREWVETLVAVVAGVGLAVLTAWLIERWWVG